MTDSPFRPLAVDIVSGLAPLLAGVLALLAGRRLPRWQGWAKLLGTLPAVAVLGVGVASVAGALPGGASRAVSQLGGGTVLCSVVAAFLLGAALGSPAVRFTPHFLLSLFGVACLLLLIEGSGRLYWRFGAPATWQRFADDTGRLRQTTGMTCEPTAAVMLLHTAGVRASEGEMAYRSGTSLFGTDAWSVAAALSETVRPLGLRAEAGLTDYDAALRRDRPAVVHVYRDGAGGHAVLAEWFGPDEVVIIDPADGGRHRVPREQFEREWDGTAVWLERDNSGRGS